MSLIILPILCLASSLSPSGPFSSSVRTHVFNWLSHFRRLMSNPYPASQSLCVYNSNCLPLWLYEETVPQYTPAHALLPGCFMFRLGWSYLGRVTDCIAPGCGFGCCIIRFTDIVIIAESAWWLLMTWRLSGTRASATIMLAYAGLRVSP